MDIMVSALRQSQPVEDFLDRTGFSVIGDLGWFNMGTLGH